MLDLGSTDFNLAIQSVNAPRLKSLSSELFDEWETYVDQHLALPDYSLFLQIEEGSINGWGKIKSTAGVFLVGISAYGGLMSGIDAISKQVSDTGKFLAEHAQSTFSCPDDKTTVRKKGGVPTSLQRLFVRVQKGELTPEEASILANAILGDEAAEVPGLFDVLANAFRTCPRHHQQVHLPFGELVEMPQMETMDSRLPKAPRRLTPDFPPPLHYRVEVWRDSKRKRKQTKMTKV
ncbi:hypothetical protein RGU70_13280 [Herbaspirillum sp. RTI4]|uniref:hypothetical protein n=1 Tax=Herbaspirillum sp. RTI4 TaxID=3048640 RepID=UPI002AB4BEAE|nr:hypothetical protein [Herbaspirillum sp. RTI4]MDY7579289.1 hypothetical protein [Herbaspirillum sp. RTI4]MEA9982788.1 hypothetical protein [Herbaspirillum sp. RTI4]